MVVPVRERGAEVLVGPAVAVRVRRILVWHWGRRGAGPLFAARLAAALGGVPGVSPLLSLAAGAEILEGAGAPDCVWPELTYKSALGYVGQVLAGPVAAGRVARRLAALKPDLAICAMPALLDRRMVAGLRRAGVPYGVVVHDAAGHPGEALNFWLVGQRGLLRGAGGLFPLSGHVEGMLRGQDLGVRIERLWHPPFVFGQAASPPLAHGGRPRVLCFGRLLPYKGLDLLAGALASFGGDLPFEILVCGDGPASADLERLRGMVGVRVDHRWVPEGELAGLLEWADGVVLPYREASQSGVAAAAVAMGRYVLATNVGGLPEQLAGVVGARLCEPSVEGIAGGLLGLFDGPAGVVPAAGEEWGRFARRVVEVLGGG